MSGTPRERSIVDSTRAAGVVLLALLLLMAAGSRARSAASVESACGVPRDTLRLRLPAAVTVTTGCGAFEIGRDRSVRRTSTDPSPVPQGASWWPYTGVWDKLENGHLVVGRWRRQLWPPTAAYQVGTITVGPDVLAFSYGNRVPNRREVLMRRSQFAASGARR